MAQCVLLVSCHWAQLKIVCLLPLLPFHQVLHTFIGFPLRPLSQLSVSSSKRYSCSLIILVAFTRIKSPRCVFASSWGAQEGSHHSRCGLTSAEHGGRMTFLELLAALLKHPRAPLAAADARARGWLTFNLVAPGLCLERCSPAGGGVLHSPSSCAASQKQCQCCLEGGQGAV